MRPTCSTYGPRRRRRPRVLKCGMASESEERQGRRANSARELAQALEDSPKEATQQRPAFLAAIEGRRSGPGSSGRSDARGGEAQPDPRPRRGRAGCRDSAARLAAVQQTPPPISAAIGQPQEASRAGAIALVAIFVALAAATIAGAILSGGDDKNPCVVGRREQPRTAAGRHRTEEEEPKAEKQPRSRRLHPPRTAGGHRFLR